MDNDLIVLVKKYFDKVNGNTYHSVLYEKLRGLEKIKKEDE